MSDPNARKVDWAPNDVILHYFAELAERPDAADTRYVLALLMVRRRLLRLEETETDEQDREILLLYCHRNETEYRVPVAEPTPARTAAIQEELAQLLFAGSS